jgi:DASS family divalent anion:Na+ symporter
MAGWVTSPWHGIPNTFVALAGLAVILLAKVLTWDDLLAEKRAWDVLIWFAPLVMMSDALATNGVIRILSGKLFGAMTGWPWPAALFALVAAYLYIHYSFASMTAQVTALYPAFFAAALAAGAPPLIAALPLAYYSSLNAATTHYGTGSAPVYFNAGYVSQGEWWRVGFWISLVDLAIWMGAGSVWWKVIGMW